MATITANTGAAGNWTAGTSWIGGSAPTAADDALIPIATTSITIDAGAVCRSANFATFTGTITMGATGTLTIGDATAGLGNVALNIPSGATFAPNASSTISFISTSATQQTVAVDSGYTLGNVTFNSASNGNYAIITTGLTLATTSTLTLTKGTLHTDGAADASGLTHSWGLFSSSNSNTRTLNLGNSTIGITGNYGTVWDNGTSTNLTVTKGNSVINITGDGATFTAAKLEAGSFNTVNFYPLSSAGQKQRLGGGSGNTPQFVNLTVTGAAGKLSWFDFRTNMVITGNFTISGNSAINRLLITTDTLGTPSTLTLSSATISTNKVDFRDITFQPAASTGRTVTGVADDGTGKARFATTTAHGLIVGSLINSTVTGYTGNKTVTVVSDTTHFDTADAYVATGTGSWTYDLSNNDANSVGNAGGNTGANFTTAYTQTVTGNSVNWDVAPWTGTVNHVPPLPQDNCVISLTAGQTLTVNQPRLCKDLSFGTATNLTLGNAVTSYGSLDLTGMGTLGGSYSWNFESQLRSGTQTITSSGKSFVRDLNIYAVGATVSLADALSVPNNTLYLFNGTFTDTGKTVSAKAFSTSGTATKAITKTGDWSIGLNGSTSFVVSTTTVSDTSGTITLTDTSSTAKTFAGGGYSYYNLSTPSGTGGVAITGANTFNNITVAAGGKLTLPSTGTQTVVSLIAVGTEASPITINTSTASSASVIVCRGLTDCDLCSITDIAVTGVCFSGPRSTLVSGTSNWIPTAAHRMQAHCYI